jgi:WD40 repeat protein
MPSKIPGTRPPGDACTYDGGETVRLASLGLSAAMAAFVVAGAGLCLADEPKLPDECKPFAKTRRARLAAVWGDYAFKHARDVSVLAFSSDGRTVIAGDERALVFRERAGGREQRVVSTSGPSVLSPDRTRILVQGEDLVLLDAEGNKLWAVAGRVRRACFSADGKRIAAISGTALMVLDADKGKEVRTLRLDAAPELVALSPDGKRALAGDSKRLVLHDLQHLKRLGALESEAPLTTLLWFGELLVTGAQDGKLRAWDPDKLQKPIWERTHAKAVVAIDIAATKAAAKKVAALSDDGALVVRDLSGEQLHAFEDAGACSVALSPDGLAVASARTMVKLWSFESGKRIGTPDAGHEGPVLALAVSADHLHVLSASTDHTARVWNVGGSRPLHVLDQKSGAV